MQAEKRSQLLEQVAAPPQLSWQLLPQLVIVQDWPAEQVRLQPSPGQSRATEVAPFALALQPPPGQEKVQLAPAGQANAQPAPEPPQIWSQSPVHSQALPLTQLSSTPQPMMVSPASVLIVKQKAIVLIMVSSLVS